MHSILTRRVWSRLLPCPSGSPSQPTHPPTHPKLSRPRGRLLAPYLLSVSPVQACFPPPGRWRGLSRAPQTPRWWGKRQARHGTARHTTTSSSRSPRAKRRRSLRLSRRYPVEVWRVLAFPATASAPPCSTWRPARGRHFKETWLGWVGAWVSEKRLSLPPPAPAWQVSPSASAASGFSCAKLGSPAGQA